MIVRALSKTGDWTFGKGANDYKSQTDAVAQDIQTRLLMVLGDCFFATNVGIDWFNLLGAKDITSLNIAVTSTILNTANVKALTQLNLNVDGFRKITISYSVVTTYTGLSVNTITANSVYLLTEDGFILTTEDGDEITT